MQTLLDRFCRYVRIDTEANEKSTTYPSSSGQLELGKLLAQELRAMGVVDAAQDEFGIVLGTLPANGPKVAPTIALIAHVDTSPDTTGKNVKPIVHVNYDGRDIVLPGDPTKVIRVADTPDLAALKGKTMDGTDFEEGALDGFREVGQREDVAVEIGEEWGERRPLVWRECLGRRDHAEDST